jgi:hypothetical protein
MRLRIALALCATLALTVGVVSAAGGTTANATVPSAVQIELLRNGTPGFEATTWSATGAFTDAGTWTIDQFICGACPSPVTGAPQFDTTETSSSGTFEMRLQAQFDLVQPHEQSLWEIVGGTGAYTNLRGHGTYSVTIDANGVRHIICVGEVHFS